MCTRFPLKLNIFHQLLFQKNKNIEPSTLSATRRVDWVLRGFLPEERAKLGRALPRAADAVACFLAKGVEPAMDRFNGPFEPEPEPGPEPGREA